MEFRFIRVLVVDDSLLVRQVLGALLGAEADFRVAVSPSGEDALAQARRLPPDVVVLDFQMPEMNGLQASRHFRAEWPAMGIILISAGGPGLAALAPAYGADCFLAKGVLEKTLVPEIRDLFHRASFGGRAP